MYDVITIGEILAEILAERVNQEFSDPGTLLGPFPSGAPAIAIDQAALMGAKTAIVAKIGTDDFGALNKTRLQRDGVDISPIIETADNVTGTAFVTYYSNGSRKFIFHFTHAACGELAPPDIDGELVKNTRCLHIMGCSVTGSPSLGEAIMKAVRLAKKHGVTVSFDPNIRLELLKGKIMDYYKELMDTADILLTGKSELAYLYLDIESAVTRLLEQKDRIIVIKDGAKNTYVYTRREAFKIAAFPAIEVDTTGAGDSFDGAFLALFLGGADIRTAALYGNAAGAKAVTRKGPMEGNAGRAVLEEFVRANPQIVAKDIAMLYRGGTPLYH
ncbi:MAG: sugar kinase [Spirochaetaceae bacterium]|nr:sugar kinase [Spirochaetaceae bacterium]